MAYHFIVDEVEENVCDAEESIDSIFAYELAAKADPDPFLPRDQDCDHKCCLRKKC